jgi:hypothetical protein
MWVAWVASASCAALRRCSAGGSLGFVRFVQLRRPATLLPSSRRAPRGCSVTVLGCSDREMEPSLPAPSWPRQASVLPLYSVTAVTARGKKYQFHTCRDRRQNLKCRNTGSTNNGLANGSAPWQSGSGITSAAVVVATVRGTPGREGAHAQTGGHRPPRAARQHRERASGARPVSGLLGAGSPPRNLAVHDT